MWTHLLHGPPNSHAGDLLSVRSSWGDLYMVNVPPDCAPGDTFVAELTD